MSSCGDARIAMQEVRSTAGEDLCGTNGRGGHSEHTRYTPALRYYAGAPRWWAYTQITEGRQEAVIMLDLL